MLVSRLFISRTQPKAVLEIRPWIYNAGLLADDLASRGHAPRHHRTSAHFPLQRHSRMQSGREDKLQIGARRICRLVDEVMELLTDLESSKSNVAIFNIFDFSLPGKRHILLPGQRQ